MPAVMRYNGMEGVWLTDCSLTKAGTISMSHHTQFLWVSASKTATFGI
jgi:hypothetical protein